MNDISSRLLKGERFPFVTLRYKRKQAKEFLDKWWEQADMSKLSRPYTLPDRDKILQSTDTKMHVDTHTGYPTFPKCLRAHLAAGRITKGFAVPRATFRTEVVRILADNCPSGTEQPIVYFTGGGYGSGKTTVLSWLTNEGILSPDLAFPALQGVDYCKQLIPEFNMVKAVADGRASEICQDESRHISRLLFDRLIEEKRSFAWDSSMSDKSASIVRIEEAKESGYRVGLIAVLTDLQVATRRAMQRAKETQRFAHPNFFAGSHTAFRQHLEEYWDMVDEGFILENSEDDVGDGPKLIDKKGK